jgi:hypothetical protein
MQCSMETRRIMLSKIFFHLPRHTKKVRTLKGFKCTGFCRYLNLTKEASERVKSLFSE